MQTTQRIVLSLTINILISIFLSLLMQGIVYLLPFKTVTAPRQVIETHYTTDNSKETIINNYPQTTEDVGPSPMMILGACILYLILMIGVIKLSTKIIPLKETATDWNLVSKITAGTTALVTSVAFIVVIIIAITTGAHPQPIPLMMKIFLGGYFIIYLLTMSYSISVSKKRVKGIKQAEVFQ